MIDELWNSSITVVNVKDSDMSTNEPIYGHLFNSGVAEQDLEFDKLIIDVTDEKKHLVIPMLVQMATKEDQRSRLRQVAEEMKFDIACLESGVNPTPIGIA